MASARPAASPAAMVQVQPGHLGEIPLPVAFERGAWRLAAEFTPKD
jgi:hypothetical protein